MENSFVFSSSRVNSEQVLLYFSIVSTRQGKINNYNVSKRNMQCEQKQITNAILLTTSVVYWTHYRVALLRAGTSQDVPPPFCGGYISEYFTVQTSFRTSFQEYETGFSRKVLDFLSNLLWKPVSKPVSFIWNRFIPGSTRNVGGAKWHRNIPGCSDPWEGDPI